MIIFTSFFFLQIPGLWVGTRYVENNGRGSRRSGGRRNADPPGPHRSISTCCGPGAPRHRDLRPYEAAIHCECTHSSSSASLVLSMLSHSGNYITPPSLLVLPSCMNNPNLYPPSPSPGQSEIVYTPSIRDTKPVNHAHTHVSPSYKYYSKS